MKRILRSSGWQVLRRAAAPALVAGSLLSVSTFNLQADDTPYGEDAIPDSRFYSGSWREYGQSELPEGGGSVNVWHSSYGEDSVPSSSFSFEARPKGAMPAVQSLTGDDGTEPAARRCP